MTKKYLANPFDHIYQDDLALSDRPEIQELNEYVLGLVTDSLIMLRLKLMQGKTLDLLIQKKQNFYADSVSTIFCRYSLTASCQLSIFFS